MVTECYNTCFIIENEREYLLVDGGGGNTLLRQLKQAGLDWKNIRNIFVTHRHIDHILGIMWLIRLICQFMRDGKYEGEAIIYAHIEVIHILQAMAEKLLQKKETVFIGERLHLTPVEDGETRNILDSKVTFFDIHSTKARQFGFCMKLKNGDKITCCGDEPYNPHEYKYAVNSKWLLHEAFCLDSQKEMFKPYEKHHSTVKDACELAQNLGVKNLVLYHTEDKNILQRKSLYEKEGKKYFSGNLLIPEDLEVIELLDNNKSN